MIEVNVRKKIQNFFLDVNFSEKGIIAITGKNGSGKSTLLNIISGVLPPDDGYVRVDGQDITRLPINKRNIVLVTPQSFIPNLPVKKHLIWGAKLRGMKIKGDEVKEVSKLLGIADLEKKVGQLSLGNKEKVSLATALIAKPKLILVNEAFSNITNREDFISIFKELCKRNGIQLIYVSQNVEDTKFSDHHYVMVNGSLHKVF
ncbi:sugar ABC transporter ATP-binding protein [Sulfolobus sp. E5]|nr:sugar ABC transporter ATP-binding protein [Sulfolobus sp. E5]